MSASEKLKTSVDIRRYLKICGLVGIVKVNIPCNFIDFLNVLFISPTNEKNYQELIINDPLKYHPERFYFVLFLMWQIV